MTEFRLESVNGYEFRVDEKLENLFGDANGDVSGLVSTIVDDGKFLSPLIMWKDEEEQVDYLIDGHRRLRCWREILKRGAQGMRPPLMTYAADLEDRSDVIRWMKKHQAERRNLSSFAIAEIRNELINEKIDDGAQTMEAMREVATEDQVSVKTVQRERKLAEAMERIESVDEHFAGSIRDEEVKLSKTNVHKLSKLPNRQMRETIEKIREGASWKEAYKPPAKRQKTEKVEETTVPPNASLAKRNDDSRRRFNNGLSQMTRAFEAFLEENNHRKNPIALSARQLIDDYVEKVVELTEWMIE